MAPLTLAVRSLEGLHCPWAPGPFVETEARARDELAAWPRPAAPVLVRVQGAVAPSDFRPGRRKFRPVWLSQVATVGGDWFVAPDLSEPWRVPTTAWDFEDHVETWRAGRAWIDAWETCENGLWMLRAARVTRRWFVRVACANARALLRVATFPNHAELTRLLDEVDAWERQTLSQASFERAFRDVETLVRERRTDPAVVAVLSAASTVFSDAPGTEALMTASKSVEVAVAQSLRPTTDFGEPGYLYTDDQSGHSFFFRRWPAAPLEGMRTNLQRAHARHLAEFVRTTLPLDVAVRAACLDAKPDGDPDSLTTRTVV